MTINERVSPKKPLFAEVHNVPDDYRFTTEELDRIISGDMFTPRQDAIMARELQQYRAAAEPAVQAEQLSGNTEQVSQPYTLTFDQWLSRQKGGIDVDCGCVTTEAFFHWLRVAYEAGNSPAIPDGYALVPVEPTQAMIDAHVEGVQSGGIQKGYRAMLAAAPQQEANNG